MHNADSLQTVGGWGWSRVIRAVMQLHIAAVVIATNIIPAVPVMGCVFKVLVLVEWPRYGSVGPQELLQGAC
jgi:hypothetical protein